ncbi:MAG: hypothetical protein ABSA67_00100 [Candidatus Brocadiia bacterium]|jgi:hypothetical protein
MKTTRLILAIVSSSALALGLGFAGEPTPRPAERAAAANRPPALKKSAPAVKGGITAGKTEPPRARFAFPPVVRPPAPPPNPAPRRGPGAASIGGPATSRAGSSAAIKGTEIRRKP